MQNCAVKAGLEYLDNVERVSGLAAKTFVFGAGKAQQCWYETKNDDEKILACLAKTIPTWTTVFNSEEGLNCVFAAKDNAEELLACQAKHNGAGAVTVNFLLGGILATLLLVRAG